MRAQRVDHAATYRTTAAALARFDPQCLVTVARGSSDHAATFLKYQAELLLGLPVASIGPSLASVYGRRLEAVARAACIAISQSGRSPDLVAFQAMAREAGALSLALVNTVPSPLGDASALIARSARGRRMRLRQPARSSAR